jgi:hypothetical protein
VYGEEESVDQMVFRDGGIHFLLRSDWVLVGGKVSLGNITIMFASLDIENPVLKSLDVVIRRDKSQPSRKDDFSREGSFEGATNLLSSSLCSPTDSDQIFFPCTNTYLHLP